MMKLVKAALWSHFWLQRADRNPVMARREAPRSVKAMTKRG